MFLPICFSCLALPVPSIVALSIGGWLGAVAPSAAATSDISSAANVPSISIDNQQISDDSSASLPVPLAQVTRVEELSDVSPTDWAYTALQRLVEEYNCIEGDPERPFRGTDVLTRYEFAAAVQACLDGLLGAGIDASSPDWEPIQRLADEFGAEIATLRARVDALEADTTELEANQFSETTRLFGQAIFGLQTRTENTADFFR